MYELPLLGGTPIQNPKYDERFITGKLKQVPLVLEKPAKCVDASCSLNT